MEHHETRWNNLSIHASKRPFILQPALRDYVAGGSY